MIGRVKEWKASSSFVISMTVQMFELIKPAVICGCGSAGSSELYFVHQLSSDTSVLSNITSPISNSCFEAVFVVKASI